MSQSGRRSAGLRSAVAAAVMAGSFAGLAQGQADEAVRAAEEGLRRQQERDDLQRRARPRDADVLHPAAASPAPVDLPDEQPCFPVQDIGFVGDDVQRFGWLLDKTESFLHRCIGVQGLGLIVAALDAELLGQGHATSRVSLPEQNLADGRLRLRLHVGRIAEVRMVDASGGAADERWGTWRNAFPLRAGDVLDIRDVEQGVEQMRRLPSQSATTRLEPGPEADTSIVVIERTAGAAITDRLRGGLTLDNSGGERLGRAQASAHLAIDDPLGLNDIVDLSVSSNAKRPSPTHRSQSYSIGYSIPWGYGTWSARLGRSRFAQTVQGTTVRFLSSGDSDSAELRWSRVLLRGAAFKSGLSLGILQRKARSYLDDVELLVQRRATTNLEAGLSHRHLVGPATVDVDLAYRRGTSWGGAHEDLPGRAEGGPTLRPHLWTLNASMALPGKLFGRPVQWSTQGRAQHTRRRTTSVDQFAIGGRGSVRGFNGDRVLIAESGWLLRNELQTALPAAIGFELAAYAALDAGRVWGPSGALLIGDALAGGALGMRGRRGPMQFDLALGFPLHRPGGFGASGLTPYLSATLAF